MTKSVQSKSTIKLLVIMMLLSVAILAAYKVADDDWRKNGGSAALPIIFLFSTGLAIGNLVQKK